MKRIVLTLLSVATLMSCSKSEEYTAPIPYLTITQTGYTCESTTSQIRVEINSNVNWKIVQQEDPNPWVDFGTTDWGIMVWVQANESYQRHKEFKVVSEDGTIEHTLTITQKQPEDFVPGEGEDTQLSVTPNYLQFSPNGGTKTVEVNSLTLWRILEETETYPVEMSITPISGTGKGTVTITLGEDKEFTAADINTFQKSFSQLSPKEQRAIELEFETVKNVINKNWAEAFATVLGTTPTSDVLTVEVATEETKIQCYVQQITDRTAVLLIDNAIVEFDINTKQPRNKQLTYRIESDLPKKYHSKIHRKEFAAEMAAQ